MAAAVETLNVFGAPPVPAVSKSEFDQQMSPLANMFSHDRGGTSDFITVGTRVARMPKSAPISAWCTRPVIMLSNT